MEMMMMEMRSTTTAYLTALAALLRALVPFADQSAAQEVAGTASGSCVCLLVPAWTRWTNDRAPPLPSRQGWRGRHGGGRATWGCKEEPREGWGRGDVTAWGDTGGRMRGRGRREVTARAIANGGPLGVRHPFVTRTPSAQSSTFPRYLVASDRYQRGVLDSFSSSFNFIMALLSPPLSRAPCFFFLFRLSGLSTFEGVSFPGPSSSIEISARVKWRNKYRLHIDRCIESELLNQITTDASSFLSKNL